MTFTDYVANLAPIFIIVGAVVMAVLFIKFAIRNKPTKEQKEIERNYKKKNNGLY